MSHRDLTVVYDSKGQSLVISRDTLRSCWRQQYQLPVAQRTKQAAIQSMKDFLATLVFGPEVHSVPADSMMVETANVAFLSGDFIEIHESVMEDIIDKSNILRIRRRVPPQEGVEKLQASTGKAKETSGPSDSKEGQSGGA